MLSAIDEVDDIELDAVEAAVGSTSFGRGRSYARANRVLRIAWDANTDTLTGSVVGHGALYDTAAFFTSAAGPLEFRDGPRAACHPPRARRSESRPRRLLT